MKTFEIGKEYFSRSICDHECVYTITITGRTAKTLTYVYDGEVRRSKLRTDDSGEYVKPDSYSMAPLFRAERIVQPKEVEEVETSETSHDKESNIIVLSQRVENMVVMIGQQVERNCGTCFPLSHGKIVGFVDIPKARFCRGGVHAVVRWEESSDTTEQVLLSDIHPQGWRSPGGSPLGVFVS